MKPSGPHDYHANIKQHYLGRAAPVGAWGSPEGGRLRWPRL